MLFPPARSWAGTEVLLLWWSSCTCQPCGEVAAADSVCSSCASLERFEFAPCYAFSNSFGVTCRVLGCLVDCQERSEEHTSELQSRFDLVCRLLLEKQK